MKKLLLLLAISAAIYAGVACSPESQAPTQAAAVETLDAAVAPVESDDPIAQAYREQTSDVQVSGTGIVSKLLPDDDKGSRHQRFILTLPSGQTVLVAHNIDLAPRVEGLRKGDTVEFNGEYEWNAKGGVIHWTHHDPAGSHEGGWLRHGGRVYE